MVLLVAVIISEIKHRFILTVCYTQVIHTVQKHRRVTAHLLRVLQELDSTRPERNGPRLSASHRFIAQTNQQKSRTTQCTEPFLASLSGGTSEHYPAVVSVSPLQGYTSSCKDKASQKLRRGPNRNYLQLPKNIKKRTDWEA